MAEELKNLVLIGYRGTGKTTVAKILAERLGWKMVDSDDEIENLAGKTIAQIFSDDGEPAFRKLEAKVVANLLTEKQQVVSLGGGAVLEAKSREIISEDNLVFWLTASVDTLAKRLAADSSTAERRPNLTNAGGLSEIQQVLEERTPIYQACATFEVDTTDKSPDSIADEIEELGNRS